jgi:S-DNA-T family DNA segregation ATPase FtsK/SpoIIIE
MPDDPTRPSPRWRLDALALTLFAAGVILAAALGGFGTGYPVGDRLAEGVVNAVGVGAGVFVAGWFAVVGLYVGRRGPGRLAVRVAGWSALTLAAAVAADMLLPPAVASTYGPGGSVGAYVRYFLDEQTDGPMPAVCVGLLAVVGLTLAADGVVRAAWAATRRGAGLVVRGNSMVETVTARAIAAAAWVGRSLRRNSTAVDRSAEIVPLKPAVRAVAQPAPAPPVEAAVPADPGGAIPITRPPVLSPTPLPMPALAADSVGVAANPDPSPDSYELPPLSLLADPDAFPVADHEQKLRDRATLLEKTFQDFGLNVKVVGIHTGPVITQYEVALETGLRLNKVTTLADDLSLNLGVSSVRIVAPLPGRTTVGVEVPNEHRQTVRLKELILATTAKAAKFKLPVFLGKDVEGRPLVYDMATMPHLLIAGRTGTGKSVCLNTIILSFLFGRTPDECRLLLIDPKKVEFSDYARVPHLMHPVVTDDKKAEAILAWAVDKMEERYELLRKARVRNIASYNELGWDEILKRVDPQTEDERSALPRKMPYVVIVVDEVGDLLMSMKKEVESHIIRLAQKSRAAGIHLILATQKPTVDVITGLVKSNLPARVCFQVASRADSAVVLDEKGAEKLLGAGDMLFLQPGTSTIIRGQGAYVDDNEIQRVTGELAQYEPNFESELLNLKAKDTSGGEGGSLGEKLRDRDPMYEQAIEVVVREQRGSTSLLQRALGIGYGRASRLIDFMAEDGIVGAFNGSNARDVLLAPDEWEAKRAAG